MKKSNSSNFTKSLKQNSEIPNLWKVFDSDKKNRKWKFVWILVFTSCTLIFMYEAINRIRMLANPPKSAFVKLILAEKLAFPSVTICPGFQFRASAAREFTRIDKFGCEKGIGKCNWNFPWNMLTHTESIFKMCQFKKDKNCKPGIEQVGKWRRVLTSLGRCFTYDSREFVNCGGDLSALEFTVDPMIWDKSDLLLFSGIRIYIHDDDEIPLAEINGINVNEGASATFSLQVKKYNWVHDPKRNPCRIYSPNQNYTKSKCILNCIHQTAVKSAMVKCKAPFMSTLKEKTCDSWKEISILTAQFNLIVNNGTQWNFCNKKCPENCEKLVYTPITSSLGFTQSKNESLITIKIYIGEMWLETITEKWAYNFDEFIADIGGFLNLFLGASFITIIQIFDVILMKIHKFFNEILKWNKEKSLDRFIRKQTQNLAW